MIKKIVVLLISLTIFSTLIWAGGGKDAITLTAEDPSGFTDTIDTTGREPGKSNYYLEAIDKAGNVTVAGPENISFDPASDLPNAVIVNPVPNMRIQGNMNVVGIAFDDDGVASVELSVTRGTDGRGEEVIRAAAQGTDFWSYFLDTSDREIWTDGNYTITAWAVDINGISGVSADFSAKVHRKSVINWILDRKKPETIVTSHEIGALVSGNIRLRGTVNDGNGIKAFSYSVDEGKHYLPVRASLDRRTGGYNWEINLNTRNLEDGPMVIWLRAVDGNESVGEAAHLLFVNNKQPEVKIVYPTPYTVVNGIFSIAGSVSHPVGVKSLSWKAGKTVSGQIELLPGNEWWTANIDLRGQKTSNIDIEIRAEDVSGNVSVLRQRYRVDQNRDLPVVTLMSPVAGNIDAVGVVVKGRAADDDGIASIFYSLNSGAAVEIPSTGYFQFMLHEIPAGNNTLEVWAKDITGVIGPKTVVRGLIVTSDLLQPAVTSFSYPGARPAKPAQNFYTGMTVAQEPRMTVNLTFAAAPVSSSVTINNLTVPVKIASSRDSITASFPLPDSLPEGLTAIQIRATDRSGRETVYDEYFFISNQTDENSSVPFSFIFVRPNTNSEGRMLLGSANDTLMGISSYPVRSVTVNGTGANNINAETDQNGRVIIKALRDGSIGPLTLSLQTSGGDQQTDTFNIIADFSDPVITLREAEESHPAWVSASVPVRFSVSGGSRNTVEYSLDMGTTWKSFGQTAAEYNQTLDLSEAEDGFITILIKATGDSGKSNTVSFAVLKDTKPPVASIIMPIEGAGVNGTIRMAFAVEEAGELQTIVYNRQAGQGIQAVRKEIYNAASHDGNSKVLRFFEVLMDSIEMPLDENMRFSFTDKAGNNFEVTEWPFIIDREMDVPVVHIILPQEDETLTTDFVISGVMFDDDDIKNIQWRIDRNEWQTLEATAGFSIPVALSSLTDNKHSVTIIAEDIYGVRSGEVTRNFKVSLSEPSAAIVYPLFDTVLKAGIEVRGTASDKNGIKDVLVSLDNGNTYNNSRGNFKTDAETTQWAYQFNTEILKDGPNVMFIRVIDNYDVSATYASMINVDNTAPEIILDSPNDGSLSVGAVSVMGRILDANLREIDIQLRSLDGAAINERLRSRKIEPAAIIREVFDLTGQTDGHYNIAVIATDLSGNVTRISRNFQLARQTFKNTVEIMYPLENETVAGNFNLYGKTSGADKADTVRINVNGNDLDSVIVDDSGFFRFFLDNNSLVSGDNIIVIYGNFGTNETVSSRQYNIKYKNEGPWVTIESFTFGNFAYNRPYLSGRAGYVLTEEEQALLNDRSTDRTTRNEIRNKSHNFTEISFDNGRTFYKTEKGGKNYDFRYRLETGELSEGMQYLVVRSVMKNGEIAVSRMLVQVDKTPPVIRLISPEEGGIYNTSITYSATATDDIELESLTYHLRSGDKSAYEVPGLLQGLYIESVIPPFISYFFDGVPPFFSGGATFMDAGLGLSFFDDNVKFQVQYGFMTPEIYQAMGDGEKLRYGGDVLGLKLLANLYSLPFGSFMGPDWEWLSASFAIGANFSYFDFLQKELTQSKKPTWLSALLLQVEFPKVTIPERSFLRTFSLFTEGQLWFIPTDVDTSDRGDEIPTVMPKIIMGLRLYVF